MNMLLRRVRRRSVSRLLLATNPSYARREIFPGFSQARIASKKPMIFFLALNRMLISDGLSPDLYWAGFLPACLSTITLQTGSRSLFPRMRAGLQCKRRSLIDSKTRIKPSSLSRDMNHARCGPRESPSDFCARYQNLALQAGVPDDDIMGYLGRGRTSTKLPESLETHSLGSY